jgi:glycosyltransferase involved in cell wall biosynthesis
MRKRMAYISFDVVPAPKGAATHIQAFAQSLARGIGTLDLVTVSPDASPSPVLEQWPGVCHHQLPATGKSLIDRVLCFQLFLSRWLETRTYDILQFRSPFEGLPILARRKQSKLVFEVNGLPSIELKYRYPRVADDRDLMHKLLRQEALCCKAADAIVTPSAVTRDFLSGARGVPAEKIEVIPNGVDLDLFAPLAQQADSVPMRLVYFGTLASWQGIDLAIRALAQIAGQVDANLTVIGAGTGRQRKALDALAAKLGLADRVAVLPPESQPDLARRLASAGAIVVPLTINDRNTVQGCCPLKVLEGMASGTPVIATDLPVVRELGCDGKHFLLVRPGSVDHLAETLLRLSADPQLARRISRQARRHVERNFSWRRAGEALVAVYERLGISRSITD